MSSERPLKQQRSSSPEQEEENEEHGTGPFTPALRRTAFDYDDVSPSERRQARSRSKLPSGLKTERPLRLRWESGLLDDSNASGSRPAGADGGPAPNTNLQGAPAWQPSCHTVGQQGLHNLEDPFTEDNDTQDDDDEEEDDEAEDIPTISIGNGTLPPRWIVEEDAPLGELPMPQDDRTQMEMLLRTGHDAWIHVDLPRRVYEPYSQGSPLPRANVRPTLRWRFDPGNSPAAHERWYDPAWRWWAWDRLRETLRNAQSRQILQEEIRRSDLIQYAEDIFRPLPPLPPEPRPPEFETPTPLKAVITRQRTDESETGNDGYEADRDEYATDHPQYERGSAAAAMMATDAPQAPTDEATGGSLAGRAFRGIKNMFGSGSSANRRLQLQQRAVSPSEDSNDAVEDGRPEEYAPRTRGLGEHHDPKRDRQRDLEERALAEKRAQMAPIGLVPVPNQRIPRGIPLAQRAANRPKEGTRQDGLPDVPASWRERPVRNIKGHLNPAFPLQTVGVQRLSMQTTHETGDVGQPERPPQPNAQQGPPQKAVKTLRASRSTKGIAATLKATAGASRLEQQQQQQREQEERARKEELKRMLPKHFPKRPPFRRMKTWAGESITQDSGISLDEVRALPRFPTTDRPGRRIDALKIVITATPSAAAAAAGPSNTRQKGKDSNSTAAKTGKKRAREPDENPPVKSSSSAKSAEIAKAATAQNGTTNAQQEPPAMRPRRNAERAARAKK